MRLTRRKDSGQVRFLLKDVLDNHFPKLDEWESEFCKSVTERYTKHPLSEAQWARAVIIIEKHLEMTNDTIREVPNESGRIPKRTKWT